MLENRSRCRHDHADIEFEGDLLRLNDTSRFGAWLWNVGDPGPSAGKPRARTIVGGKHRGISAPKRGKALAVKPFIMDSKVVVESEIFMPKRGPGSGPVYPARPAGRIWLGYGCLAVLSALLQQLSPQGGTTLLDFSDQDGRPDILPSSCRSTVEPAKPASVVARRSARCSSDSVRPILSAVPPKGSAR
ncbi:MAG: hypothetical protein R2864_06370 [Syntrophotaleaceae bacterium]